MHITSMACMRQAAANEPSCPDGLSDGLPGRTTAADGVLKGATTRVEHFSDCNNAEVWLC
jgi:hypothetical protein